ncbi:MAG: hypothetical protein ACRDPO_16360, partial [Streptosporangiaceae bacterium]
MPEAGDLAAGDPAAGDLAAGDPAAGVPVVAAASGNGGVAKTTWPARSGTRCGRRPAAGPQ